MYESYIYFMQCGNDGPIKIGVTSNVQRRLKQAQTFNYQKVELLGHIPGTQHLETEPLKRYSPYRLNGEWFRYNEELYNLARGIFNVPYEKNGERSYLVLCRDTPKAKTDPCPFCLCTHSHGLGDGHRVEHCHPQHSRETITTVDGTILHRDNGYIILTRNPDGPPPKEKRSNRVSNVRFRAVANLLTFAVNKFLELEVFSLDAYTALPKEGVELIVEHPDGTRCKIRCYDAGFDEVGIKILYDIKLPDPPIYTFVSPESKEVCSAHAAGWLERRSGKYLQLPNNSTSVELYCEKGLCKYLADFEIQPTDKTFLKTGRFHL